MKDFVENLILDDKLLNVIVASYLKDVSYHAFLRLENAYVQKSLKIKKLLIAIGNKNTRKRSKS